MDGYFSFSQINQGKRYLDIMYSTYREGQKKSGKMKFH